VFAKRQACMARGDYRHRGLAGPAVLVTIGVLSLLDNLNGPRWDRTWPVILLVIGAIKLLERSGHLTPPSAPVSGPPPGPAVPPEQQPPSQVSSEVKNG